MALHYQGYAYLQAQKESKNSACSKSGFLLKWGMANNLPTEKKVTAISMLAEGCSIRAIERMTEIHRDTIMRLGVRIGEGCAKIQDEKMRGLVCKQIEVDEIWGFIGKKKKNTKAWDIAEGIGDVWTFIALDVESKVIPSFLVGQRTMIFARAFMADLASRMENRIQLSSDGLAAYRETVATEFGSEVDYGQIVKTYSITNLNKDAASRYSPAEVVKTEKTLVCGMPNMEMVSTSHIEKQNHTLRMHCRRLTRLTWSTTIIPFHRLDSGFLLPSLGRCLSRMLPKSRGKKWKQSAKQHGRKSWERSELVMSKHRSWKKGRSLASLQRCPDTIASMRFGC